MSETASSARPVRLILGIDPGTAVTGFGLIRMDGNRLSHVEHGVWRSPAKAAAALRLLSLCKHLEAYIRSRSPVALGIEQAFLGKNIQSTLRLGEARGALMVTGQRCGLTAREFAAATVKKTVTGQGRASKEQVQFMVAKLLKLPEAPHPADAADALAVAITLAMDFSFNAPRQVSQDRR